MDYTVEVHAEVIREFVETENILQDCCSMCPVRDSKYYFEMPPLNSGYSNKDNRSPVCKICQEFVFVTTPMCPCGFYNCAKGAVTMANHALALWDAGEHPMQEER